MTAIEILERAISKLETLRDEGTPGPWECDSMNRKDEPEAHHAICVAGDGPEVIGQLGCGCCDVGLEGKPADLEMVVALSRTVEPMLEHLRLAHHDLASPSTRSRLAPSESATLGLALAILGEENDHDR